MVCCSCGVMITGCSHICQRYAVHMGFQCIYWIVLKFANCRCHDYWCGRGSCYSVELNRYFLEHSCSKDRFQSDVSTSRVFISHKQLTLFLTDEDPRGRNGSLKSVFAMWMLKKVSVQSWFFTTVVPSLCHLLVVEMHWSVLMLKVDDAHALPTTSAGTAGCLCAGSWPTVHKEVCPSSYYYFRMFRNSCTCRKTSLNAQKVEYTFIMHFVY